MVTYHSRFDRVTARRKTRQEEALTRQQECDKLTPQGRLDALDARLGVGVGAIRERIKLHQLLGQQAAETNAKKKRS